MRPSDKLSDHIFHIKTAIPSNICDDVVSLIRDRSWQKNSWYNKVTNSSYSEDDKELSMLIPQPDVDNLLDPFVFDCIESFFEREFYKNGNENTYNIIHQYSKVRLNRYEEGQMMKLHHDHISSLFDGQTKGIPVASMIINFNDGYTGGDLVFWDDYVIPLEKGDVVLFPSLYLYPHRVTELQSGVRYSGACWMW